MAERRSDLTPARFERGLGLGRPRGRELSPFIGLQRLADEMDRVFEGFGIGRPWAGSAEGWGWAPQIEVFQKNNELTIRADLPGLRRDDLNVEITDDAVHIQGERKLEREEEREGYYRSERSYGSFNRVIPLPEGAIGDQAKATFKDGVLEITMPAPPGSRGRRLEITEGGKK